MSEPGGTRPRVVVVGGGLSGLVTAWELSQGDWRDRFGSITVYQRGWRLGGKGASSRGPHGRIEEHGLHVLLGYYDATFRVLREVYGELDRATSDPDCPIVTWRDAVEPAGDVGLADHDGGTWGHFVTRFSTNDQRPGEPGAEHRPLRPLDIAVRAVQLLLDFQTALGPTQVTTSPYLSGSPTPRSANGPDVASVLQLGGLAGIAGLLEVLDRAARLSGDVGPQLPVLAPVGEVLTAWRDGVRASVLADPDARRVWQLVDLAATNLVGMLADGLLTPSGLATGAGFERIDHLDYREWLARHGASPETLDSSVVRGMYDLVFAYEGGDKSRPRFSAGLGLQLAARMLLDFKGAIFWRMQAGMGEVVFAPLYQALAARGVQVRFFHRLDRVALAPDGRSVAALHLTRQADLRDDRESYEPLVRVGGLPCWPDRPLQAQLRDDPGEDCESWSWAGPGMGPQTLRAGEHFDVAVLAVSVGMVPHVAGELVAASPRWRTMVDSVATVGTRAAQLWLDESEAQLGWTGPTGVTLSGFGDTFDTWASMTHLLVREGWEPPDSPRSLAYLCSALPDHAAATHPDVAGRGVRDTLHDFLDHEVGALWPGAVADGGFRWQLLHDPAGRTGPDRLEAQYVRANVDPSDRYVQSLPGTGRHRIAPGDTGFDNLAVAGDWTACGLDAGCAEAATRSGVLAARAVLDGRVHASRAGVEQVA